MTLQKGCEQPARDHTLPWLPEEYCVYRKQRLICHYVGGVATVFFPGGGRKRAYECKDLVLPLKIRPTMLVG